MKHTIKRLGVTALAFIAATVLMALLPFAIAYFAFIDFDAEDDK